MFKKSPITLLPAHGSKQIFVKDLSHRLSDSCYWIMVIWIIKVEKGMMVNRAFQVVRTESIFIKLYNMVKTYLDILNSSRTYQGKDIPLKGI